MQAVNWIMLFVFFLPIAMVAIVFSAGAVFLTFLALFGWTLECYRDDFLKGWPGLILGCIFVNLVAGCSVFVAIKTFLSSIQ